MVAAALAAFFMLPLFGFTAYAGGGDGAPEYLEEIPAVAEEMPETEEAPPIEETAPAETPDIAELPALPPGVGTVIDYNTDPDGRLFYTIMTPDEHVFYLVIDKTSNSENVYFLNAVTIADLAALAELPDPPQGGTATPPPTTTGDPEPGETPPPAEQPQGGGNMGMYIIVGLLVIGGGGAGWYFKIYRPKQQGAASGGEYDPSMDEAENGYADDWGADEQEEADDSPPWDEGEENGNGEDE
jgi:hypothetical protein